MMAGHKLQLVEINLMASAEPDGAERDVSAQLAPSASETPPAREMDKEPGEIIDREQGDSPAVEPATARSAAALTAFADTPPLPYEDAPPLPAEPPPEDDGWQCGWDATAEKYYFYNRFTGMSQWENPRQFEPAVTNPGSSDRSVNDAAIRPPPTTGASGTAPVPKRRFGGYNPAIHGSYDPNADYAKEAEREEAEEEATAAAAAAAAAGLPPPVTQDYATVARFNRFTGRFQDATVDAEYHNDENKSKRQLNAFFDVDAAANDHDGRSLKAERRGKSLSKKELKAFQSKRREKKEEKRRAWLRD